MVPIHHVLCTRSPVDGHFAFQFEAVGSKTAGIIPLHVFDGHVLAFLLGIYPGLQMPVCDWDHRVSKTGTQSPNSQEPDVGGKVDGQLWWEIWWWVWKVCLGRASSRGSQIIVPSSLGSMCFQLQSWLSDFGSGSHRPGQAGQASLQGVDPPTQDPLPWVFAQ